jgi:dTMP kinase
MATPTGIFITFEGPEGSGKSTQITRLAARFRERGREVVATREPGGTEIGEQIRNIVIHNSKGDEMCPEAELLLYTAARAQLVREVIRPALARGAIVLSDRYLDSSAVYQGVGRDLPSDSVSQVNRFAVGGIMPQLTLVIDVPTEVSRARITQRATHLPDRMERAGLEFFQKIRDGYLALARQWPERVVVLDGTHSPDAIEREIWAAVSARLAR